MPVVEPRLVAVGVVQILFAAVALLLGDDVLPHLVVLATPLVCLRILSKDALVHLSPQRLATMMLVEVSKVSQQAWDELEDQAYLQSPTNLEVPSERLDLILRKVDNSLHGPV